MISLGKRRSSLLAGPLGVGRLLDCAGICFPACTLLLRQTFAETRVGRCDLRAQANSVLWHRWNGPKTVWRRGSKTAMIGRNGGQAHLVGEAYPDRAEPALRLTEGAPQARLTDTKFIEIKSMWE